MTTPPIKIISTNTVHASNMVNNTSEMINMMPCGISLLFVNPMQMGLLFNKPLQDLTIIISQLKTSLSTTLTFFPSLAGRLLANPNNGDYGATVSYHVACNNYGALFVHAVAEDVIVEEIMQSKFVVYELFSMNGTRNCDGTRFPLLGVQVTELKDGVFIGCTMNHVVADGSSFWHFFKSWAEICRGCGQLSKPPLLDHQLLRDFCSDIHVPVPYYKEQQLSLGNIGERIYHFSRNSIAKIKERAKKEAAQAPISSLQAILAHIWRAVIRNTENLDIDSELIFILPIGLRQKIRIMFPDNYFGCAIKSGVIKMSARELLEENLGHVSVQLNKIVSSCTEENCIESLKSWIEYPHFATLDSKKTGNINATFLIYNSPRFDVYEIDFGWGKPLAARSGIVEKGACGFLALYPGVEEGSINIEICVLAEALKAMENDLDFMDAFTV